MIADLLIRFFLWLARKTPPRVITGRKAGPYLTRYFLHRHGPATEGMDHHEGKTPRFGLYLHHFHRSDDAGALHSHPWKWAVSLVLKGGYSEERRRWLGKGPGGPFSTSWVERRRVRPWSFNILRGSDFHRVDLNNGEAWTLFLVGPVVSSWGFWDRVTRAYTPWRKFLGIES